MKTFLLAIVLGSLLSFAFGAAVSAHAPAHGIRVQTSLTDCIFEGRRIHLYQGAEALARDVYINSGSTSYLHSYVANNVAACHLVPALENALIDTPPGFKAWFIALLDSWGY